MKNPPLRRGIFVLQDFDNLHRRFSLRVTCRRNALLRGVADGEDGDEVIVCHLRECLLEFRRVEMPDPCRTQSLIVNGEHDVGCDNACIYVGEVALVVLPHPRVFVLSTDNEENARTEGVVCRLRELCPCLGALDCSDLERLLVDGGRRDTRCLEDAPEYLVWDLSVREGAAGESILYELVKFHKITSLHEPLKV